MATKVGITETEAFWQGEFGNDYTTRNWVDWGNRKGFWQLICNGTNPASVLELGCNRGHNLVAIKRITQGRAMLTGLDINKRALGAAEAVMGNGALFQHGSILDAAAICGRGKHDLVFTAGVLIHVAPEDLDRAVRNMIACSSRYVLAIEYEDTGEVEVEYRGFAGRLWRRPYGDILSGHGLRLISTGDAGEGFDDCTFWLFEKRASQ